MRELVFSLRYEPGRDAVAETLAEFPDARVRSRACHVTADSLWRIDHATGPRDALDALEARYLDPDYCADCLTPACDSEDDTQVLDGGADYRVVYVRWSKTPTCTSVPHLALAHLGDGALFETVREGRAYRWRVLAPDDADVSAFHSRLRDAVDDRVTVDLERLHPVDSWRPTAVTDASLPDDQAAALAAAVERGYYEVPREVELTELSEELGVPSSTLSYRLRRAENRLAHRVADRTDA